MTDAPSIRKGLSRVVIQVSLAWSVAVFLVVWFAVHHELDEVLDGTLQESAEILYGLLKPNADRLPIGSGGSLPAPPHHERMVWQLVSGDQRVVWRSHSAPAQPLAVAHREKWSADSPNWHVYGIPFDEKGTMLYVAQTHSERSKAQLEAALLTACGALLVGLACAVWLSKRAARELDPLIDLSEQVAHFHPLEPGSSPPLAKRAELKPVRDAIVHLGDRLAQNIISERAFSANAAHALRTPLAGLGAQLALLQRESPTGLQPRIQRAREASDRLSRVVTALLSLFRSGGEISPEAVDLGDLVKGLPLPGLSIVVEGHAHVLADPDLCAAALLNLLDNSVRYGASEAHVSFRAKGGFVVIRVHDNGPGVDDLTRKRISLALASQQYERDMGLGLMLADRVARVHGGQLTLVPVDQGFAAELSLRAQ